MMGGESDTEGPDQWKPGGRGKAPPKRYQPKKTSGSFYLRARFRRVDETATYVQQETAKKNTGGTGTKISRKLARQFLRALAEGPRGEYIKRTPASPVAGTLNILDRQRPEREEKDEMSWRGLPSLAEVR